ncbi:MAG: glycoside hydrolase family 38 C-terminal domain-containing protein [Candidatus Krumholzibacteriia bacterium]
MLRRTLPVVLVIFAAAVAAGPARAAEPAPKVYAVATSHLDTQWRWTIQTTIDEYLRATLDDNFALLETYPDYVFNFEGAFRYQLMQEYYPARFERLKQYVDQGRWRVCGSWLDAVDVNMPSPESLFRQALYGNGWFRRELGTSSVDVFLPDCFGFGYALPSIMAHCGLAGFSTQKLTWGSAYGTPFDVGRWRGVDGSEVVAAVNPGAYVSVLEGDVSRDSTVVAAIARTVAVGGPPVALKYYGTGDTGGAPSEGSVQWLERSIASDGPVKVMSAGADQLFRELTPAQTATLPVYDGELVMTSHGAGCYTSQAAMKRWYRRCEVLADAAERAATLAWWLGAKDYPHQELERAWTRFLWHGFHDDLTGTSIPEAYAFSWNDLLLSQQEFAQVLESSLGGVLQVMDTDVDGQAIAVFNPLDFDRTEVVTCRGYLPNLILFGAVPHVIGPDGAEVPSQRWCSDVDEDPCEWDRLSFVATVPANGVAIYRLTVDVGQYEAPGTEAWDPATNTLQTDRYRLVFGEAGLLSLFDKRAGRELLAAPPVLQLLHDEPRNWAAWEVDHDDVMAAPYAAVPLGGIPVSVDAGPVLDRLTFVHEAAGSIFRQTLTVAGDRLDWELDIDWATKGTLLKAAFFTAARDTQATYDLGLGAISRGLNRPRLYEVPAQRWADVTDRSGDFGLTIMNDGRHGWDRPDEGTLRLTLLHTPAVNDGWRWIDDQKSQDLGRHVVTIGMLGHGADWRTAAVREADRLNQPLLAFRTFERHPGPWGRSVSLLHVGDEHGADNPRVVARAIKKSEDGDWLVVRLQEVAGEPARGVVVAPLAPAREFRELRADEIQITASDEVELRGGALVCDLAPYQPRTFALKLAPVPSQRAGAPRRSEPLDLPWNLDGISTHADPTDGDLDGSGISLPSELIPGEFVRDGVRFRTGPRERGAANLLRCQGQVLEIPGTAGERHLQLIACAVDGPREVAFQTDRGDDPPVWFPDGREFFGQWDSRLVGEDVVHDAGQVTPAYVTEGDLGWIVTHRHEADGTVAPYVFTHFYRIDVDLQLPLRQPARTVTLPDDPAVVILAASVVAGGDEITPICDLVDRPRRPSVRIEAPRRTFVDSVTVRVGSPTWRAAIWVQRGDGPPAWYDGQPLVLTETTDLTVRVAADFADEVTRTATFTRLDPWPATGPAAGETRPGLAVREYLGAWTALPDWSQLATARTTTSATIMIPSDLPEEDIGAVFTGYVEAPRRGVYRFWLSSDDGSRLWLGDHLLVDHDGLHGSSAIEADAPLDAGLHPIKVEFFQHLGGRDLKLEWSGPGFARQEVPAAALSR